MENEFGTRLYAAMRRQKMTAKELANKLGRHPNALGMWTRGERRPSYWNLIEISRALDVSIDYLCGIQRKATKDETEQLRRIVVTLMKDVRDLNVDLQTINTHAELIKRWAMKHRLIAEDDE